MNSAEQDTTSSTRETANRETLIQPRDLMTLEEAHSLMHQMGIHASFRSWFNGRDWVFVGEGTYKRHSLRVIGFTLEEAHTRLVRLAEKRGGRRG